MVETKTLSIIGLVLVAGVLLALIGTFTGQGAFGPTYAGEGQSCSFRPCASGLVCVGVYPYKICKSTTEPSTPTPGLTTQQKQDVLNMLNDKTELWARIYVDGNYYNLGKGQGIFIFTKGIGITLENVGDNGEIAINIDGVISVLSPGRKENINTLNGEITMINLDTYYVFKHPQ